MESRNYSVLYTTYDSISGLNKAVFVTRLTVLTAGTCLTNWLLYTTRNLTQRMLILKLLTPSLEVAIVKFGRSPRARNLTMPDVCSSYDVGVAQHAS